ncbi:hypothetical protein [Blastococcus sp. SYSU DS0539]
MRQRWPTVFWCGGLIAFSGEHPAAVPALRGKTCGEHLDQSGCQEHDSLAAVLGRPDLDLAAAGPLHLAGDGKGATQEVDVLNPEAGGLAEPEAGERAEGDERPEGGSAASTCTCRSP